MRGTSKPGTHHSSSSQDPQVVLKKMYDNVFSGNQVTLQSIHLFSETSESSPKPNDNADVLIRKVPDLVRTSSPKRSLN